MEEFKHDPSSISSHPPGGSNLKALTTMFLLPFKEVPGFCWIVADMDSLSTLADSKFFLLAITYHSLILVLLTGVTWD